MRKFEVTGNIVKDAEFKETPKGKATFFTICANEVYKTKDGQKIDKAYYHDCAIWSDSEKIAPYLKKGKRILVNGQPEVKAWLDKDNTPRADLKIRVNFFELQEAAGSREASQQPSVDAQPTVKDDLPF